MEESCRECGFDASRASTLEVATALSPLAVRIGDGIRMIPDEAARRRPTGAVWSPLEYLGHLRESMAFHRWLVEHALSEENPSVPMVDPDESVAQAGYRAADPDGLIGQFECRVQRLVETLRPLKEGAAERTVTLGERRISVALVARSAWHECHHHLGDIERLGQPA